MASLFELSKKNPFNNPLQPKATTERKLACASTKGNVLLGTVVGCILCYTDEYSCEFGSSKYYALCGFGGILSCGLTHTAVVPLDIVKCRVQVRPCCNIVNRL